VGLLVIDVEDRYALWQAHTMDAVYGDLLPGERCTRQRALAETLAAQPALPRRSMQYCRSGGHGIA
jgi:hypothetical protein